MGFQNYSQIFTAMVTKGHYLHTFAYICTPIGYEYKMYVETTADAINSFQPFQLSSLLLMKIRMQQKPSRPRTVQPKTKATQELRDLYNDQTLTDYLRCTSYNLGIMNQSEIQISTGIQLQAQVNVFGILRKMLAFVWFLSFQRPHVNYSRKKAKCKVHTSLNQPCGATNTIHISTAISLVKDSLVACLTNHSIHTSIQNEWVRTQFNSSWVL